MPERDFPKCPICGQEMPLLETNPAFRICRGTGDVNNKRHYQDILYSTKHFPNGHKPNPKEIKSEKAVQS